MTKAIVSLMDREPTKFLILWILQNPALPAKSTKYAKPVGKKIT